MYKPPLLSNSASEYCLPDSEKDTELLLENEEAEEGEVARIKG